MDEQKQIALGSLFDGIGGFSYAGSFFNIKTIWASEILPQAISVTTRHFPEMKHLAAKFRDDEPIPINDRATRHQGGGETRNGDGCGNGLGVGKAGDPAPTLSSGDHHMVAEFFNFQQSGKYKEEAVSCTQLAHQGKDSTDLICESTTSSGVAAVDCRNLNEFGDVSGTLQAKSNQGYSLNFTNPVRSGYIVRRLTPVECERLQGFEDGWTAYGHDGKEISDTRRYQMLGNSVAIPCVAFVLGGIAAQMRGGGGKDGIAFSE